jgi:hypothetical protein
VEERQRPLKLCVCLDSPAVGDELLGGKETQVRGKRYVLTLELFVGIGCFRVAALDDPPQLFLAFPVDD